MNVKKRSEEGKDGEGKGQDANEARETDLIVSRERSLRRRTVEISALPFACHKRHESMCYPRLITAGNLHCIFLARKENVCRRWMPSMLLGRIKLVMRSQGRQDMQTKAMKLNLVWDWEEGSWKIPCLIGILH